MNNYFEEHNKKRAETLKKYMWSVRIENYLKVKVKIEDKAFIIKSRKEKKAKLEKVREVKKRPVYDYERVHLNHLHKTVKKSEITPEMQEKEIEFWVNYRNRII